MNPSRRPAREAALRALYEIEVGKERWETALNNVSETGISPQHFTFCVRLVKGYLQYRKTIDPLVASYLRDWTWERIPAIDRNLLRMAAYELLHEQVPPAVTIDEAVELAKRYSTVESSKFINGVLASLLRDHPKEVAEEFFEEAAVPEPELEEEEEITEEEAEEVKSNFWKIRKRDESKESEEASSPTDS